MSQRVIVDLETDTRKPTQESPTPPRWKLAEALGVERSELLEN
jgi:hypothetical protein